jgi:hypothetical protein
MCGRGGGRYKDSAPREHFAVAASAATNLIHTRYPRAERGAKVVERAFARGPSHDCHHARQDGVEGSVNVDWQAARIAASRLQRYASARRGAHNLAPCLARGRSARRRA